MPRSDPQREPVLVINDNNQSRCCHNMQKTFIAHPCLCGFMFISIVTLDLAEATNDWLLYFDISRIEKGLIYGPLNPYLVLIFLIICSISSVAFCFEILNLLRDLCTGRPLVDLDLVSAIIVWLCDVSMMVINIVIALCHSEPISFFQLTKAILVIIGVVLRIAVPLARVYIKHKRMNSEKFRKSVYRVATTIGVCLMLAGAVTIFIFTHVISSDDGKLQFLLPQQIWEGKLTYKRYFTDIGIYFHHKMFKFANLKPHEQYWIKLADIKDFYNEESINFKISYGVKDSIIHKLIINSYNATGQRYKECYIFDYKDHKVKFSLTQNCGSSFIQSSEDIVFRFVRVHPHVYLILGDIIYNAKFRRESSCYNLTANETYIYNTDKKNPIGQLQYMKHDTQAAEGQRLVQHNSTTQADSPEYKTQHFLLEAYKVWKLGMYGCDCTGRRGPTKNESVNLSC